MAAETEAQRLARARTLADEQAAAAVRLAEDRGREQAVLNGHIESHERRLNAINGSIERGAKATEALTREVAALKGQFAQKTEIDKVRAADQQKFAEDSAARQVDKRTFIFGLCGSVGVLATILGVIEAVLQGGGHS